VLGAVLKHHPHGRSRTSAENFGDFDSVVMAPVSQELEPPANPGRFI
jgi:hypothetical protein